MEDERINDESKTLSADEAVAMLKSMVNTIEEEEDQFVLMTAIMLVSDILMKCSVYEAAVAIMKLHEEIRGAFKGIDTASMNTIQVIEVLRKAGWLIKTSEEEERNDETSTIKSESANT